MAAKSSLRSARRWASSCTSMLRRGVSQKQLVEHIGDYTVLTSTVNYAVSGAGRG